MINKKWIQKNTDESIVETLQHDLKIHPVFCRLLALRQIHSFSEAKHFFRTDANNLHDPFLMKGMLIAVQRIHQAIVAQQKIMIYGDYDVDGTTAVAVAYRYFKALSATLIYYIPHRFTEGYGVSEKGIDFAIAENIALIITLDCGIKSVALIAKAKQRGIDTIVCDHHLPGDDLPPAYAILNPKQPDCNYPYKELCGCGIAYKLIFAYAQFYQTNETAVNDFLDLVATAIAADIVPITGENRALCVMGLQQANHNPSVPLKALRQISVMDKPFTINDLVFIIAPRVNAAGRMDDARKAVDLFLATDQQTAKDLAMQLHEDNNDRRDIDKSTTAEAIDMLHQNNNTETSHSTVVYQPHWHKGVVGIVASRLIEQRYCPTIVLTSSNGKITGSARSIKGFNMFEGLNECAEYLENYGGHYFAAGLTLNEENLLPFTTCFEEVVRKNLPHDMLQPCIEIDAEVQFKDINEAFLKLLNQFSPHGPGNMKPIFLAKNVMDYQGLSTIVKEKHIRFVAFQHGSRTMNGIGFNMVDKLDCIKSKPSFDMLFHIEENSFNGKTSIQLKVLDVR
jgi:single-stranded-DNA-specific exonuclease